MCGAALEQHGANLCKFTQWFEKKSTQLHSDGGEFFKLVEMYRLAQLEAVAAQGTTVDCTFVSARM